MNAQGKHENGAARMESLLRAPDAAPWAEAPAGLHDRVMASLDAAPASRTDVESGWRGGWRVVAMAASVAIIAGGLGLVAGAAAWRNIPADRGLANSGGSTSTAEAPTVLLARAFDDLKPAGSSRLVASVAAPMRTEVEGLAAETRLAARTVLSRLPFVSMD